MSKSFVITLIGEDRPGIVEELSTIITGHNGEWVESRLANLSGKFSGILSVVFPDNDANAALQKLKSNSIDGVSLQVEEVIKARTDQKGECFSFEIIGHDKPGIVQKISTLLAKHNVTINTLDSEIFDASMTGEKLFQSNISVRLIDPNIFDGLCEEIEMLGVELVVEIDD